MSSVSRAAINRKIRLPIDFDHLVSKNWFGPIAVAMHDKSQDYATVGQLIDLTFKALGIITRSGPRKVMAAAILRAVRALVSNGTLDRYGNDRVRVRDAVRLERYRQQYLHSPLPTLRRRDVDQTDFSSSSPPLPSAQHDGRDLSGGFDDGYIDEPTYPISLPPLLRHCSGGQLLETEPVLDSEFSSSGPSDQELSEDEQRILSRFLDGVDDPQTESPLAIVPTSEVTELPPLNPSDSPTVTKWIPELLSKFTEESGVTVKASGSRLEGRTEEIRFSVELRLNREVRVRIWPPDSQGQTLLEANNRSWYLAPIGGSPSGSLFLMRAWTNVVCPDDVARQILNDIQFIKDAIADED
ncbi:MAG: hypothetical protein IPP28_13535 [Xanthomonadales bacterium]|nr:hypothetical protein [Xanthomonadales bacterium]